MKLRIRGDSLRIRVSQAELGRIATAGRCTDSVRFAGGRALDYGVEVVADGPVAAVFEGTAVTLRVPRAEVERWTDPAQVSITAEQALDDGGRLALLLEKDFVCLTPREGEDEGDLFPNPNAAR